MNVFKLLIILVILPMVPALGVKYEALSSTHKAQIEKVVAQAILAPNVELILFQVRADEPFRPENKVSAKLSYTLDLRPVRFAGSFRGVKLLERGEFMYLYNLEYKEARPRVISESRIRPVIVGDDSMWISFVKRETAPLVTHIEIRASRHKEDMAEFVLDSKTLDADRFMDKYELNDLHKKRVYSIYENGAFKVDMPGLSMEETKAMRMNRHLLDPMLTAAKSRDLSHRSLKLTVTEMEDIIYLCNQFPENVDSLKGADGALNNVLKHLKSDLGRKVFSNIGEISKEKVPVLGFK